MPTLLTKSHLLAAVQCQRKLWLEIRRPDLAPIESVDAERRKKDGNKVGELARKQMGSAVIWPRSQVSKDQTAERAKTELLSNPTASFVEFPMYFDDVYARADALVPTGDGTYILRETKATTFPLKKDKVTPDKPDFEQVLDLAIQAWLLENSGLTLARAELNLINNRWRYPGGGNYDGLFRIKDITDEVKALTVEVPGLICTSRATVLADMPVMTTGKQCSSPHSCGYLKFCEKLDPEKPEHPIELLPDAAGKKLARELKADFGYVSLLEPAPSQLIGSSSELYVRMQTAHRTGLAYHSAHSGQSLVDLPYPRYYFDFEGIDLAIPVWEGVRPYEQIPFQWSCHVERSPGVFELGEFLDLSGGDPSVGCIEQMLKVIDLKDNGPIFVYFATYERSRLNELAIRHPQYASQLETYASRLVDLLPVVKSNYYHPLMMGSFSIKKVLPRIAPDLDYSALTEVSDGTAAQVAYIKAALSKEQTAAEKAETEKHSRIYCRQDTWAMVETAYFLAHKPRPARPLGM
jgi:hypothetical protein